MIQLLLALIIWAVVHSITAGPRTKSHFQRVVGQRAYAGTYRLIYNILSALTLIPVFYLLMTVLPDQLIWSVPMPYRLMNFAVQLIGLAGLAFALLQTDVWSFLGIRQFGRFLRGVEEPDPPVKFITSGAYGLVRHPLYLFSLLYLWGRPDMTVSSLVLNLWVTLYFVVGSIFEERRLIAEFGDDYLHYQQRVPRLVPLRIPSYSDTTGK